eukprot:TRINITY_DN5227_c0_g1_i2.p1 TRINITY_DN5227_c0_g1~~TRINITY_DN5227_c0_g1_i2.p1  ORF type:complete len:283 (+),score=68.95 TRINITY_DN5227_c0_g1_i2:62-910(+)
MAPKQSTPSGNGSNNGSNKNTKRGAKRSGARKVLLTVLGLFVVLAGIGLGCLATDDALRHAFFGKFWLALGGGVTKAVIGPRTHVLSHLDRLEQNPIVLLELGAGTGENLQPLTQLKNVNRIQWTAVEPNPVLFPALKAKVDIGKPFNFKDVTITNENAESFMKNTADNSVDAVLTTLVLCSVDEQSVVLSEIFRVLKPGGKFLFLEHVICPHEESNSWLLRPLQDWLSPFWRLIGGGCELNRDTEKNLQLAGFKDFDVKRETITVLAILPLPLTYGSATKP